MYLNFYRDFPQNKIQSGCLMFSIQLRLQTPPFHVFLTKYLQSGLYTPFQVHCILGVTLNQTYIHCIIMQKYKYKYSHHWYQYQCTYIPEEWFPAVPRLLSSHPSSCTTCQSRSARRQICTHYTCMKIKKKWQGGRGYRDLSVVPVDMNWWRFSSWQLHLVKKTLCILPSLQL